MVAKQTSRSEHRKRHLGVCVEKATTENFHGIKLKFIFGLAAVRLPARPPERTPHGAVIVLLAQAARVPPSPPLSQLVDQIVLHRFRKQNLCLLRQTRDVRKTRRPAARTPAHESLLRFPVDRFRADVARLTFRVVRARLDRDLHGRLMCFVGVVLFRVTAAVDSLADLLVPAAPVVVLAGGIAVSRFAPHAPRRVVDQWRGAGGAVFEDHV